MRARSRFVGFALLLSSLIFGGSAAAEGKPKRAVAAKSAVQKGAKPAGKQPKAKKAPAVTPKPSEAEPANAGAAESPKEAVKPASEADAKPRPAGTTLEPAPARAAVKEQEGPEGVKTYQFGAIEVEGRQKSPQLIYFLRRVRAEFDAGLLGHRSFLGELSDSRNDPVFR